MLQSLESNYLAVTETYEHVLQPRVVTCTMSLLNLMTEEHYRQIVYNFSDTYPLSVSMSYFTKSWTICPLHTERFSNYINI